MGIPSDYVERVYAGMLGKIIGVYLGRPFEGWTYDRIMAELGEINYYVHDRLNKPLIVTDDDITGTLTFLRALPDYHCDPDLTPAQIGETWLNYIVEQKTILWWGGLGVSTEHTAYLRLKHGIPAPESGSIARNGKTVAEQIGAQIFIDGWAMVAPGDPERAVDLARRASSVSHDGEAVYAAQVVAAMEALAFVEPDLNTLLDTALALIPGDALIRRLIDDVRLWHTSEPDWRVARERLEERYGYDKFGGSCHIVPNHGLIILSLLYGADDFQKTLMIVNTSGWDTDCNSGNVGCLLGIKNGLAGIEAGPDWRGPIADRLYLPTADGGRAITDAVTETFHVVNVGRAFAGLEPIAPKNQARFHFELPGSVQGFQLENSREAQGTAVLENVPGHSESGQRALAVHYHHLAAGRLARVATPTFIPPDALHMEGYALLASPTLYPGQVVRARVEAGAQNRDTVLCRLYLRHYDAQDQLKRVYGPGVSLKPGAAFTMTWPIEHAGHQPIAEIGIEIGGENGTSGSLYLDYLTWNATPDTVFTRPSGGGTAWLRAWVQGTHTWRSTPEQPFIVAHNEGRGLVSQGTRDWTDYEVSTSLTPHLSRAAGVAMRVQGLRRFYALLLREGNTVCLCKMLGSEVVLAEREFKWEYDQTYHLRLGGTGAHFQAWLDGQLIFDVHDPDAPLLSGGIALVCEEGSLSAGDIILHPIPAR